MLRDGILTDYHSCYIMTIDEFMCKREELSVS